MGRRRSRDGCFTINLIVFEVFWGSYPMILLVCTHLSVGVIVLGLSFLIFDEFLSFLDFWVLKNGQNLSKTLFKHV